MTAALEDTWSGLRINFDQPITDPRQGRVIEQCIGKSMRLLMDYRTRKANPDERALPNWVNGVSTGRILSDEQVEALRYHQRRDDPLDMFFAMDLNKDDRVSFEEFHGLLLDSNPVQASSAAASERHRNMEEFGRVDGNGDGFMSRTEFELGIAAPTSSKPPNAAHQRTVRLPLVQFLVQLYVGGWVVSAVRVG